MGTVYDNIASSEYSFGTNPLYTPNTGMNLPRSGTFKFVDSIENVRPNELPMDGSWGVYILQDLSKVYMSRWTVSGIESKEFVVASNETSTDIEEMISGIVDNKLNVAMSKLRKEFRQNGHKNGPMKPVKRSVNKEETK